MIVMQGVLAIAVVMALAYVLVEFVSSASGIVAPHEPINDWMPHWTHPEAPGWHETRCWMGQMRVHERAYWDGDKWRYEPPKSRGDAECYVQDREWQV